MGRLRLRTLMAWVAIVAVSFHLGGSLERAKQRQANARAAARPPAAGCPGVVFHPGAFW